MSREYVSTEFDCRRVSVIVHRSSSDKLNECLLVHNFQNNGSTEWHVARIAKEYRSITAQWMSQNLPKGSLRDFLSLRHPNHFVLVGSNNRNVIITYRFLAAPVQANRDFFYIDCMTVYFSCTFLKMYARVTRVPPRDFAFWAKSPRGQ